MEFIHVDNIKLYTPASFPTRRQTVSGKYNNVLVPVLVLDIYDCMIIGNHHSWTWNGNVLSYLFQVSKTHKIVIVTSEIEKIVVKIIQTLKEECDIDPLVFVYTHPNSPNVSPNKKSPHKSIYNIKDPNKLDTDIVLFNEDYAPRIYNRYKKSCRYAVTRNFQYPPNNFKYNRDNRKWVSILCWYLRTCSLMFDVVDDQYCLEQINKMGFSGKHISSGLIFNHRLLNIDTFKKISIVDADVVICLGESDIIKYLTTKKGYNHLLLSNDHYNNLHSFITMFEYNLFMGNKILLNTFYDSINNFNFVTALIRKYNRTFVIVQSFEHKESPKTQNSGTK